MSIATYITENTVVNNSLLSVQLSILILSFNEMSMCIDSSRNQHMRYRANRLSYGCNYLPWAYICWYSCSYKCIQPGGYHHVMI